jgi:hypothetical protein
VTCEQVTIDHQALVVQCAAHLWRGPLREWWSGPCPKRRRDNAYLVRALRLSMKEAKPDD